MNFGKKLRSLYNTANLTKYAIRVKRRGFPDFQKYFPFPSEDQLFYFWFDSVIWYAKTNRISKKWSSDGKVLQITKNLS